MHAFTVWGVLRLSRTREDSVEGRGVRSGMSMRRIDFWERREAHQGMDLKCVIGSRRGWLWEDFGLAVIVGYEEKLLSVERWRDCCLRIFV